MLVSFDFDPGRICKLFLETVEMDMNLEFLETKKVQTVDFCGAVAPVSTR